MDFGSYGSGISGNMATEAKEPFLELYTSLMKILRIPEMSLEMLLEGIIRGF